MGEHSPLSIHTFKGQRFDDHGIDLEVLPEFAVYHKIVCETAKVLWRTLNPGRERLKRNIEEDFRLKIFEINHGSVSVPIEAANPQIYLLPEFDVLRQAVDMVQDAIACADGRTRFAPNLPNTIIPMFSSYGKTLRDDEFIEYRNPKTGQVANFSRATRDEFERRSLASYTDEFDILAQVIMMNVHRTKFSILVDKDEIEAPLNDDDKGLIFDALQNHERVKVRLAGEANYTPDGVMTKIIELTKVEIIGQDIAPIVANNVMPFWQRIAEIGEAIPIEELAKIPKDASSKLDHYLYSSEG